MGFQLSLEKLQGLFLDYSRAELVILRGTDTDKHPYDLVVYLGTRETLVDDCGDLLGI